MVLVINNVYPNIYFRSGIYIYFFVPYRNQNYWTNLAQIWYGRSLGLKLLNRGIPGQRRVPEVTICYLWDTLVFEQSRIPAQADGERLRDI